jgi:hypothetical protein
VQAFSTDVSRMIVARFGPDEDIFESLRLLCQKMDVESGCISTMIGSLQCATLVCVTEDFPGGQARYLDPVPSITSHTKRLTSISSVKDKGYLIKYRVTTLIKAMLTIIISITAPTSSSKWSQSFFSIRPTTPFL